MLRLRSKTIALVVAVILTLVGAAVGLTVREWKYGPLTPGSFGGLSTLSSFSGDVPPYRLTADSGQLLESMSNRGSLPIEITSMSSGYSPTEIQWSEYRSVPGGSLAGLDMSWRNCPATKDPNGMPETFSAGFTVHWKSTLFSHTSFVESGSPYDVVLC